MTGQARFKRSLRWYPKSWRQRYGDELVALMEDTHGDRAVPLRCRLALVRAGTIERLRQSGLEPEGDESMQSLRSGALQVLWAWAVFAVAGTGFAKFAEHWEAVTPTGARWLPAGAYDTVAWAALAGALTVLAAAAVSLPTFVRSMSQGGWQPIRTAVLRAIVVCSATVISTVGLVTWAHHLRPRERNGALWPYAGAGVLWALMVVVSIVVCCAAAVTVASRLRFSAPVLRLQGTLAIVAALAMVVVMGGVLVWWGAVATDAPSFLSSGPVGIAGTPAPPALVLAGVMMLLGLSSALRGASRVARALHRLPSD